MQPSLSPNQFGKRIEFDRNNAAAAFEGFANAEGQEPLPIGRGESVEVQASQPIVADPETGHSILALIEVPREEDGADKGHVALGYHPERGYYLAGPEADLGQLNDSRGRIHMETMPLHLGSKSGDKATIGRDGMALQSASGVDFTVAAAALGSVSEEFGSATSRKHLAFEVTPAGIEVTNLSDNTPRIITKTA